MLRPIHDDALILHGLAFHGEVRMYAQDTATQTPERTVLITDSGREIELGHRRFTPSVCLFDRGMPAVTTPPELASEGGELWNKAICGVHGEPLPWGTPIHFAGGDSEYHPEHATEYWIFSAYEMDGSEWWGGGRTGRYLLCRPTGTSIDHWSVQWLRIDDEVIGQGRDQPDYNVPFEPGSSTVGPPRRYLFRVLSFWRNKVLLGIWGLGEYARTISNFRLNSAADLPIGLLELECSDRIDSAAGLFRGQWRLRVVEDRARATGDAKIQRTYAENGKRNPVITQASTSGSANPPACGRITHTFTLAYGTSESDHRNLATTEGWKRASLSASITDALLLAAYDAQGNIQTARYDIEADASFSSTTDPLLTGSHTITETYKLVDGMSGPACALSEVRHNGFAVAGGVTLKQQNARLCAIVRGFDGKEVDRVERIGQRTEQSTYLSGGEGAWYEYERGDYVQATGDNIGSLWLSVALDSVVSQRPLPIGRHLSGGWLTRVLFAEDERDFVAAYSNCLGGIARSKPGGYIAGRRHTHYTFGPAASPGGTDNRTFAMAVQAESGQEARALSGSYNPVTHQIARHSPDYQSSWL